MPNTLTELENKTKIIISHPRGAGKTTTFRNDIADKVMFGDMDTYVAVAREKNHVMYIIGKKKLEKLLQTARKEAVQEQLKMLFKNATVKYDNSNFMALFNDLVPLTVYVTGEELKRFGYKHSGDGLSELQGVDSSVKEGENGKTNV